MRRGAYKNGPRTGNRTDRPLPATQPVQTATGQPYGQAGQLQQAQQAIPLARQGAGAPSGGPGTPPDPQRVADAFAQMQFPQGKLNDPTTRPDEHLSTGTGAFQPPPQSVDSSQQLILQMAQSPYASAATIELANYVASGRA